MMKTNFSSRLFRFLLRCLSIPEYQRVLLVILLMLVLVAFTWGSPNPTAREIGGAVQITATPSAFETPVRTLDPEYIANTSQTDGIILGATLLVIIIIVGTWASTRQRFDHP